MISVFHKYHRHVAIVVFVALSMAVATAISFVLVNRCFQYFSASPMNLEDRPITPNSHREHRVPHYRFRIGQGGLN